VYTTIFEGGEKNAEEVGDRTYMLESETTNGWEEEALKGSPGERLVNGRGYDGCGALRQPAVFLKEKSLNVSVV
jgi:hypothetical protein